MKLLAGEERNVCVVGDEDQSIYSWRGADIRNILEFEKDFPGAKTVRLEQNYRSTQIILEAASAVVARNAQRKGKKLWTVARGRLADRLLRSARRRKRSAVHRGQYSEISAEGGEEQAEPKCAVLYRTNSQSRLVEEAMRRYGIAYTMVGGFSFYERAEIKDLLSYLKLVQNPHDSIALQRAINTPARGIGKTTLETLERIALETGTPACGPRSAALWMQSCSLHARSSRLTASAASSSMPARCWTPGFAEKLAADVVPSDIAGNRACGRTPTPALNSATPPSDSLALTHGEDTAEDAEFDAGDVQRVCRRAARAARRRAPCRANPPRPFPDFAQPGDAATLPELIKFIIDRTGYIRSLEEEGTPEAFSRIENLKELANAAQDAQERGETLAEFLDHAALVSDADQYDAEARVTLMTLHAAKGLEFPLVVLAGMEEGPLPAFAHAQRSAADGRRTPPLLRGPYARHGRARSLPGRAIAGATATTCRSRPFPRAFSKRSRSICSKT